MNSLKRNLSAIIVLASISFISGCGGNSPQQYETNSTIAKSTIEKALSAWKSGGRVETIAGKPAINMFDARWQNGAKLESFEVLDEVLGNEHRQYKVRIKLENEPSEVDEYLVVGIDPLLVFRDVDYRKTSGL